MTGIVIIYEVGTKTIANAVASKIGCSKLVELGSAVKNPKQLKDSTIGLFSKQEGKGVSSEMIDFITNTLPAINLDKLEYLFSVSVGNKKPYHSLKVIEKLCNKNGIVPSYNLFIDSANRADKIRQLCSAVKNGDIKLAEGSPLTYYYMKFKGIK